MTSIIKATLIGTLCVSTAACDSKDWAAAGYQDGYAATINTTCKFRSTLIHGEFDKAKYAEGYSKGAPAGALAVAQQGCAKLK